MHNEIIFYNGFNLLVDIIIGLVVFRYAYRAGFLRGYGEGEDDYRDHAERAGEYYYEMEREGGN
jgi:hypothetical protein